MNWVGGVRNRLKVQNDKRQKVSHFSYDMSFMTHECVCLICGVWHTHTHTHTRTQTQDWVKRFVLARVGEPQKRGNAVLSSPSEFSAKMVQVTLSQTFGGQDTGKRQDCKSWQDKTF